MRLVSYLVTLVIVTSNFVFILYDVLFVINVIGIFSVRKQK